MAAGTRKNGDGADLLLESIRVENIRGFDNMVMAVGERNAVLVGPNNAGKTSVLRILDWVFNSADPALL
jgi:predicted ATP-dependent endonuclease of OLD family